MFEATYPGVNWRKLTMANFQSRLDHAHRISTLKNGTATVPDLTRMQADDDNRRILVKMKFPAIFGKV